MMIGKINELQKAARPMVYIDLQRLRSSCPIRTSVRSKDLLCHLFLSPLNRWSPVLGPVGKNSFATRRFSL
jgi:hypothetical protein